MFFPTRCPHCSHENRAEYTDSNIHDIRCGRCGKRYCVFVRKHKFEVLFDLGTRALLDGYAREAVSSFAAAQERFFEFYVRAFTLERAANSAQPFEEAVAALEATWRHVVSQSERQLGMFALAYLLREGAEPDFLTPKALGSDFRNKVIHRGYLPTTDEVNAYAARVFGLIDRLLRQLGPSASHVELLQEQHFAQHLAQLPDSVLVIFEEHPGMFRARRFGGSVGNKLNVRTAGQAPMNDAQAFAQAISERGHFFKSN